MRGEPTRFVTFRRIITMLDRRAAVRRAIALTARETTRSEREVPVVSSKSGGGVRVATPIAAVGARRPTGELRSPLAVLDDGNSPRGGAHGAGKRASDGGGGSGVDARAVGGRGGAKPGVGTKPRSRLSRSRSASDEAAFAPVLSFDEILREIGASDALNAMQKKTLESVYEESLEARSLRVVLENVKDSELELAHEEAKRRDAWAKSLESTIESKWEQRVKEVEKENADLRLEAHRREMSHAATQEELKRVSRLAREAPTAPTKPALVDATVQATDHAAMLAHREEIAALNKKLQAAEMRAEQEARQHELEFNALNDELAAVKETSVRRLQQELVEAKDRAAFYERCSNTADERANNAEATAHALREEFLIVEAEAKSFKSQMVQNAKSAVEEKESIMCALAAAQARASEAENAPFAQKMSLQDVFNPSEISCKCGSVETAQRLSAALADSTSRNTELQSKIAQLQEKLSARLDGASTSFEGVEKLEKRALAAERRLEVARTAMSRYVTESQKCSPAPVVHSTIDDLTPLKHAVERWKDYSDAHPSEDARRNDNVDGESAESSDSEDEFDSPGNHRGVLPTPRLRARVAIRLAHGPAHKIPHGGAYKSTTDEELRRRAKVMGLSTSPFSRH